MLIPIDNILYHPGNARKVAASQEADDALMESMAAIGQLQPILVVRDRTQRDPHQPKEIWELRAGARRLTAARRLGWTEIAAVEPETSAHGHEDVPETAMSAAENMVRAPMHPVDQWRAIRALREQSAYSLETAAGALGVEMGLARRMEWLSRMADPILDALGQGSLPTTWVLRTIALADHDRQIEALRNATHPEEAAPNWSNVAEGCTRKRMNRADAIFPDGLMAWDEDLFAEPEDENRFSTAEVDVFMELQRKALDAIVEKGKGRFVKFEPDPHNWNVVLPKGWHREHGTAPKRFAKDDPRKIFICLYTVGTQKGEVRQYLAHPHPEQSSAAQETGSRLKLPRPPINKKTQQIIAGLKADAVRERLEEIKHTGASGMLRALLLLHTFKNVTAGGIAGSPHGSISQLIGPDGRMRPDVTDEDLGAAAAWLVGAAITFDAPDNFRTSGKGAEWLAVEIGAQMPRTDTPEILKGISSDSLVVIANQHGVATSGTPAVLRKRLAGALENWRAADFGAAGPQPVALDPLDWSADDPEAEDAE